MIMMTEIDSFIFTPYIKKYLFEFGRYNLGPLSKRSVCVRGMESLDGSCL